MIPSFVVVPGALWPMLPPGIHDATLEEVKARFAINEKRAELFRGFNKAADNLFGAGCPQIFLDGSYVTAKPEPNDFDGAWDARFVNPAVLDPVFLNFAFGTALQKAKYLGELFPASYTEARSKKSFFAFFQEDKQTGAPKGIVRVINNIKRGGSI